MKSVTQTVTDLALNVAGLVVSPVVSVRAQRPLGL
jgi:hypothetical protein